MPPRLRPEARLVIATHNRGKADEIADLLRSCGFDSLVMASSLDLSEPVEDAETFVGNAELKARAAARETGLIAIADDSGLVVPALGGDPGVRSARWAGPERDYRAAMEKIEAALAVERGAQMFCALAVAWPDGESVSFEGRVDGALIWPPRGELGFGYEPMFVPEGATRTYGEMPRSEKHADDPRARAFARLRAALLER